MKCQNQTDALIQMLRKIDADGEEVLTRGFRQKEVLAQLVTIEKPNERVIVLKNRNNNIFALIAETLWVLAGRNDLVFLEHYLPRAVDFSDDGMTWRAAYGPRLRNWDGIDQFEMVIKRLKDDLNTKRAVMSIYDPGKDFVDTKDVPCNNWLHFMARKGRLNLDVSVRANDTIWGFGGINTFEWSVLLQLMAYWTNLNVGKMTWFTSTMHVYSRHYTRYKSILDQYEEACIYNYNVPIPKFSTKFEKFSQLIAKCLEFENKMRKNVDSKLYSRLNAEIKDPLFKVWLQLLFIYNAYLQGRDEKVIDGYMKNVIQCDFKVSAHEFFKRKGMNLTLDDKERAIFEALKL